MQLINITENEVLEVQKKWASGVLNINKKFLDKEDYFSCAEIFLDTFYAFDLGDVLFKPTFASETQFRLTKKAALSYFVGGDPDFTEDTGFALMNWQSIQFKNQRICFEGDIAITMGNYFMTKDNVKIKVEYSLVYKKDGKGNLRIILHDSHLPYISGTF